MANSLLDFVMSLVRDPDAAARYAADPAGAIADAQLTNVTSVDVNNLIPVVADSLSMAAPTFGGDHVSDGNVWTSGAATAAFDAFDAQPPSVAPDAHPVIADLIQLSADPAHSSIGDPDSDPSVGGLATIGTTSQVIDLGVDHQADVEPVEDRADAASWEHPHPEQTHAGGDHPGFDLF